MKRGIRKSDLSKRVAQQWDAIARGEPALLDDFDFSKKAKPRAKPVQAEKVEVQRPLVVHLRRHLPEGSVVFAIPNLSRSRQQTFALLRDGMLPGVPDLCIIIPRDGCITDPSVFFIECKHPDGGTLNDAQREVQRQLEWCSVPVLSECRSVRQAVDWLQKHGVQFR